MKRIVICLLFGVFFLGVTSQMFSQGNTCAQATPFCLAPGASFNYPNVHNGSTAAAGPNYGCLGAEPDPSWFYIKTTASGTLTYTVSQGTTVGGTNIDVDYCVWGPFTAASFPNACSNLTNTVSCSFSAAGVETVTIPATAAGQYFVILITNYSGVTAAPGTAGYVNITAAGTNNPTDCSITCPGGTNHNAIVLQMQDSANAVNGTSTYIASGSTLACNKDYYVISPQMPATLSDPATDILTPCLMIDYNPFKTNLDTKGQVTVNEAGSPYWQFCPTCAQTISNGTGTNNSDFEEYLLDVDPSQVHDAVFCKVVAAGALGTTTVTLKNCWDNTIVAGPQTWSGAAGTTACFTLSVPANTALGTESYSISPASGASGLIDSNWGDAFIFPNYMAAGTYTITYHFNGPSSCPQATGTFVITVPAKPNVVVTPSSTAICTGSSTTLTASGANTYTWNTSATTAAITVNPTSTTSYTVTGTNTVTACTNTAVATVTVNSLPTVSIAASPSPSVCLGSSSSFTASGASTYTWTSSANGGLSGASGSNVSGTPTTTANATYTVNATDANGCKNSASVTINVNPLPTLTLTASSATVCSSTSATLTASGANTYTWSSSVGGGLSGTSGSSVTASPTSSPATYTVTGTNTATGCVSAPKTTTITITATPTVTLTQASYTTCLNSPVTFTASGAGSYNWTPTTNMAGSTTANPVVTPTSTATVVYSVTGSSSGCTSSAQTVTLTVNPLPTISVVPSSTAICSGGGSSTLTASGASTYTWANPATLSSSTGSVVIATPTNTAAATVYTVTGTDANNCVNKNTVSITVNPTPTVNVVGGGGNSQTVCGGGLANANVAGITFTSTPSGSVTWANSNTAIGVAASGSGNIAGYPAPTVTAQTTGVITASATASGCTSTGSSELDYTITINPIPGETGETITPAGCGISNGTIIGATGTGGSTYSYSWNGGPFTASSSYTNAAGTYQLQIKDNTTGCIYGQNFTIPNAGAPPAPTVTASATSSCVGGTIVLTAPTVAGVTYNWTEANGTIGTGDSYTVTNIPATPNPYTIDVTATSAGCTSGAATTSITINPPPTPAISSTTSQICQGSSTTLSVTPTGNYSYQWGNSSGPIAGANGDTLVVTAADTYSVLVTDNTTNCSASTSANGTITVNALPTIDTTGVIVTQSSCSSSTGNISNVTITGAPTINYNWTMGSAGGSVVSSGSGTSATLSNVSAGIYCLNVTDGNNCQASFCSITITNAGAPSQPVLTAAGNDTTYCFGDPIQTLTVTSAGSSTVAPTINWYSDAGLTTSLATNTNTYTPSGAAVGTTTLYVTATDNGCTSLSLPITITINPTPQAPTYSVPTGPNAAYCEGSATQLSVNSGAAPSTAVWYYNGSVVNVGSTFTPPASFNSTNSPYVFSIIDSMAVAGGGCTSATSLGGALTITLTVNPTPQPPTYSQPTGPDTSYCEGSAAQLSVNSGAAPSTAVWYYNGSVVNVGSSFTPPASFNSTNSPYVFSIIDSMAVAGGGCTSANSLGGAITITVTVNPIPPAPTYSVPTGPGTSYCDGSATQLSVNSGAAPSTAVWYYNGGVVNVGSNFTPPASFNATNSPYVFSIIDSLAIAGGGCTSASLAGGTITITLTVNPTPTIDVSGAALDSAMCGQATGGVHNLGVNNISSGTPGFHFQWYSGGQPIAGATSSVLSGQQAGNYNLVVTDTNGCVANVTGGSLTFSVPASAAVQAAIGNANPTTGTIPLAVTFTNTSSGANVYAWSFGDSTNSISANPTHTYTNVGTYTVVLVASNGACVSTTTMTVITNVPTSLIVPNIFSPNADGINDVFYIPNTGISTLTCDIFNRWGQLLHTITAPNQGWDGITPNGDKAPDGTYMYILNAKGLDGQVFKQQGTVTLVR